MSFRRHSGRVGQDDSARRRRRIDPHRAVTGAAEKVVAQDVGGHRLTEDMVPTDQGDLVGEDRGQVQIVHHGHHAGPGIGILARDLHDLKLMADIERRNRLVEEQPARHAVLDRLPDLRQNPGQLHALLLAARQFLVKAPLEARKTDPCQRLGAATIWVLPAMTQETVTELDEVILGKSKREVRTDTARSETNVDQEEIEDRQASTNAELTDSVPGVTLINGQSPQGSGINIRGFGANSTFCSDQKVLIQVDDADVGAEELYRIGTQPYTDPALYKRVTVIRGMAGTFE